MLGLNRYRKKLFVSSRIQGQLLYRIALYWVLYHVVLWHALFVYRYLQSRMSGAILNESVPFSEMYGQFLSDYYPLLLCAAITLPIVTIDMLKMTHRIAGPLVRFQNALRDLIAGKPIEHVSLRKGDLLTEFQDEFNRYLDVLSKQRQQLASPTESADEQSAEKQSTDEESRIMSQVTDLRETIQQSITASEDESVSTDATS